MWGRSDSGVRIFDGELNGNLGHAEWLLEIQSAIGETTASRGPTWTAERYQKLSKVRRKCDENESNLWNGVCGVRHVCVVCVT